MIGKRGWHLLFLLFVGMLLTLPAEAQNFWGDTRPGGSAYRGTDPGRQWRGQSRYGGSRGVNQAYAPSGIRGGGYQPQNYNQLYLSQMYQSGSGVYGFGGGNPVLSAAGSIGSLFGAGGNDSNESMGLLQTALTIAAFSIFSNGNFHLNPLSLLSGQSSAGFVRSNIPNQTVGRQYATRGGGGGPTNPLFSGALGKISECDKDKKDAPTPETDNLMKDLSEVLY